MGDQSKRDSLANSQGFAPIVRHDAKVLILGSMPGQISLAEQKYYAHPRNAFWPIMDALLSERCGPDVSYSERVVALKNSYVAVWDVIAQCQRPGSLDASIVGQSIMPNDFDQFLDRHRKIRAVFFNGGRAAVEFNKRVVLSEKRTKPELFNLLSTSPANARYSFDQKLKDWSKISDFLT